MHRLCLSDECDLASCSAHIVSSLLLGVGSAEGKMGCRQVKVVILY